MGGGGVVMAGQGQAAPMSGGGDGGAVGGRMKRRVGLAAAGEIIHLGMGEMVFPHVIFLVLVLMHELALAGRVVHQADDADQGIVGKGLEQGDDVSRGQFAAQMQPVFGAQMSLGLGFGHAPHHHFQIGQTVGAFDDVAAGNGVEHGGDSRRRHLGVMGHHGGVRVPAHLGTGQDMAFQIVGVQFDQPGQQHVAAAIDRAGGGADARRQIRDQPVPDVERTGEHRFLRDDAGIGQHEILGHGFSLA